MYRNATDLYVLVVYPAILLNLFISSNDFFGEIFRVLCMYDLVFCKKRQFCFFLSNLDAFLFIV